MTASGFTRFFFRLGGAARSAKRSNRTKVCTFAAAHYVPRFKKTMNFYKKYNLLTINILLSMVASLVINFSYLLAIRQNDYNFHADEAEQNLYSGVLHISKDGYGHIVCNHPAHRGENRASIHTSAHDDHSGCDSIYISMRNVGRLELRDGSIMTVQARPSRHPGGNKVLAIVHEVDGRRFDYGVVYNRPSDARMFAMQFFYFFAIALALASLMTVGARTDTSWKFFLKRGAIAIVIAVAVWFVMPVMKFRSDEITINLLNTRGQMLLIDPVGVLKCSFVLVFALLYGRTYQLINQRESIVLENEQLKNENLAARYNTLVGQINPHFLFNSLNSLSSLVREGKNGDAVTYIDRLSDTFRYTMNREPDTTTTLGEELEFVGAYKHLLEVRYDGKLFIDIDIPAEKLEWRLPTFSIQPLIENAVKHNTITRAQPLRISVRVDGDKLVVSNPINPKISPEKSSGIGLANLQHRWQLLTDRTIEVENDGTVFTVKLPFIDSKS